MSDQLVQPRYALNKAYRKVKISRADIEKFKGNLIALFDNINPNESEEFHKNMVADFLKNTFYGQRHFINTKGRNDQVIHNGANAASTVGVIIEAKSPVNKAEMVRTDNLNAKAFHELVLYYLRERITHKNLEIKHLVATNIHEWFVFDAHAFDKEFAQNKQLVKQFTDFEEGRLAGTTTDFFYANVAKPAIEAVRQTIPFVYFDLRDYQKTVRNADKADDTKLIALYKLLSAEHLLKLPFANDSNSLDKTFYAELLHIIGLTEIKEGSKKLIQRKKEGERNPASLLESTIFQLDQLDKLHRLPSPSAFGANKQERLFNVGLELVITWVNRVLFLKLLEAQLLKYHKGNKQYAFLNLQKVKDFDALNKLFFSVLAVKPHLRVERVQQAFAHVPYLNSSLFETTDLEQTCLFISQLEADTLPLWPASVIKDHQGKRRSGQLDTLEYLFEFLNAYDFSSDGGEEIQEENKSLINASVLGLIFEKINGYRDGSFFTPGFVTMYMCSETIRRAVVDKFNAVKNWNCTHFDQLYDKIDDKHEANAIINSLKICDPAVGSGHFLVSALNEIIAVKSELKILRDRHGKTLRDYTVEVLNDELIVTDDDGRLFEYNPHSPESQRVQETLFHEKQTIIENCLFGVDINPNSVKICRLRLWIELLKNTYYKTLNSPQLSSFQGGVPAGGGGFNNNQGVPAGGSGSITPQLSSFKGGVPAGGGGSEQEPPRPSDTSPYKGGELAERASLHNLPYLKTFRKELRNNLTPAEATLWTMLKGKALEGRKFRRQHSVANYILDFYCPEEQLAVELDGDGHFEARQAEYDAERDLFLKHVGIKVLRFENRVVWENPEGMLQAICDQFGWKKSLNSPPSKGGVPATTHTLNSPPSEGGVPVGGGGYYSNHTAGGDGSGQEPPRPADTPPYKGGEQLETLPNIDINIKCGNSLISRYPLDANIKAALKRSKWTIDSYRLAVMSYRNAQSKDEKRELERLIRDIKNDFETEVAANDKRLTNLNKAKGELMALTAQTSLFERSKAELTAWQKQVKAQQTTIENLEAEIEQIRHNQIFENAFEWRFEFPEVLNDDGDFVGFDVVIGNPPYGISLNNEYSNTYSQNYNTFNLRGESYTLFIERAISILKLNSQFSYIIPDTLLNLTFTEPIRNYILENSAVQEVIVLPSKVFNDATVDTILLFFRKEKATIPFIENLASVKTFNKKTEIDSIYQPERCFHISTSQWHFQKTFNVQSNNIELELIKQIDETFPSLNDFAEMFSGIKAYEVGKGVPPQTEAIRETKPFTAAHKVDESWLPFFDGKHISRYKLSWNNNNWIHYGPWLAAPRLPQNFEDEKILIRKITGDKLIAHYIPYTSYCNTLLFVLKLIPQKSLISYKALLGIINSSFIGWYFHKKFQISEEDTFPQIMISDILKFPIPNISNAITLELDKRVGELIKRNADTAPLEAEIDQLVYQLYGLTADEIQLVEGS